MQIEKISDVIIPSYTRIGDNGWEEEVGNIIRGYADYYDVETEEPTPEATLVAKEVELGIKFPIGLRLFYQTFGAAYLQEELLEVEDFRTLYDYTPDLKDRGLTEEELALSKQLIAFGDYLGNGNMWCWHISTNEIYYYDHDTKPFLSRLFTTFDDYLKALLIVCQGEMGQDIDNLEDSCEKLVEQLYGEDIVFKWRY
ncbi:SMI1/KNR4 family protein [Chitinophaga pendula]|uniref:SMI1/KNR4 family protein n=1 Tax=Chitinophaga TaxID=79328 RepID=UPI000BAFE718|nr:MULTISPECIES: SMI1/KNR4 family protein [Chitinophaga]ASZ11043.1 hypothetical protein CK934_08755 [Chitinophaga sp. MD30]UCJ05957.1 SMI1/KNR4 family protein [Chitinophaga pendula]